MAMEHQQSSGGSMKNTKKKGETNNGNCLGNGGSSDRYLC